MSTVAQPEVLTRERTVSLSTRLRGFLPELVVAVLLVLGIIVSSLLSPFFLDLPFLIKQMLLYTEIGILALAEMPILISGNLDLSIAAMLALVASAAGQLFKLGVPMEAVIVLGLMLGTLLGLFNGVMVSYLRLPSLVVTLGTLALYRGIATIMLGERSVQGFPKWFIGIDDVTIPGTIIPAPLIILLILALILGLVLHRTVWGRWIYSIGTNEVATRFAAVPVQRVKLLLFTLSGFMAGLAGLMMDSRLAVARYDHANGFELDAITIVVLGGTSIYGGRGTVLGTLLALVLIVVLRTGMGVANVKAESQLTVVGALLIIAVIAQNILSGVRRRRAR